MPQFDPSTFASQIFWLVVTFGALYWVVARIAVPRISEVIEQRTRLMQDDIDRAAFLKAETDQAIAAYDQAIADARSQAQDHIRGVTTDMKAKADTQTAEVMVEVNKQIADAEARIGKAKSEALDGLRAMAADTARDVVGKLASLCPAPGAVDTAVSDALKESR